MNLVVRNFLIPLVIATTMFACSFYSKDKYLKDFHNFVLEVEENASNYTSSDWDYADMKFTEFTIDLYEDFRDELTDAELHEIGRLKGRYSSVRIKKEANTLLDRFEKGLKQVEGFLESFTEPND